ncbi:amino acid adenylation domain-containing protein [Nonomuraea sp. KM90]|uniref:amino acid adenylation domain-containing protein n=1 Tax=Nonomuraea sp. KM90 TaxID=3457428 RepID=UPI003FCC5350
MTSALELFLRAAAAHSGRTAVVEASGATSYSQLLAIGRRTAGALRGRGVRAGRVVAVRCPPGAALLGAQLGVWLHRGIPLLLDPSQPRPRAEKMLQDARPAALITDGEVEPLDSDLSAATGDPAYLLYTSGSTGQPKGVLVGHDSFGALIRWHLAGYRVTAGDTASSVAAPSFDAFQWETWPYLCAGARICFAPPEVRYAPWELGAWFAAEGVDLAFLPTPLAEAYVRHGSDFGQLRCLLTGGDRLRLSDGHPLRRLVNHYGPTEATVLATSHDVGPAETGEIPIGAPIPSATVILLDEQGREASQGELVIGGGCLALGYWGRDGLAVPLPGRPGRWYRTGDLAARRDGTLRFLGRLDRQLKVRGARVEPGEIEAVLRGHPLLDDAVVGLDPADGRLLAIGVTDSGHLHEAELREFAAHRLPPEMVPGRFHVVSELPLTAHGKVDFAALDEEAACG